MHEADDRLLLLRYQESGDAAALEALVLRNHASLLRFVLRLCRDAACAEDIVQHAWLRILELSQARRYRADNAATFRTFLFTLARNRYVDQEVRSHRVKYGRSLDQMSEHLLHGCGREHDCDGQVAFVQAQGLVREAMETLPPEQKQLLMHWMSGVELSEVARATGTPWATLVSRKKYGIRRMRGYFDRAGVRVLGDVMS